MFHIVVYLFFTICLSQNIDAQTTINDTLIINKLIETADSIMVNEPKNAIVLVDSAMVIAKELGLEEFEVKCLKSKSTSYYYLGELSKAIDGFFALLSYYETQKDSQQIVSCYNDIGTTYAEKMEYNLSLKYLYKAMNMRGHTTDTEVKANIIGNIGYTYLLMDKYGDAHEFFNKALTLLTELNKKEGIATINNNIGRVYLAEENYDLALTYFEKALNICKEIDQKDGIAMSYNYLGILKYQTKEYNEAIKYFSQSADIRKKIGDIRSYLFCINNIAHINNLLGNYTKAISIYEEALSKVTSKEDNKDLLILLLANVNKVYATVQNYPKAYEALKKYVLLNEEVYNTEKSKQIEELKIEFETEQKEAEIENLKNVTALQNESLKQRQMIIFLLIGSLSLIGLVGYFGIARYRLKTQQYSMELEQRLFRSQMNPHFIFNSLSVIQAYIFKGSPKEAASYLSNFGKLMRHILENSREEYVLLEKELETLNHYLSLQNLRHDGKLNFTIDLSDNIFPDSVRVPPMLAQPFIENAIEHGMFEKEGISILVKYIKTEENMRLVIEDNGIGIKESQNKSKKADTHKSLAISITESRLQLFSKRTKKKYKLKTLDLGENNSNKSGTKIEVELPYLEEF